jgi:predicted N-acetyltransferase YhbS
MSVATLDPTPTLQLRPERPADAAAVERLIGAAFGPGRYAKTAERLREGVQPSLALSFLAWDGDLAVGCVRLWPIHIGPAPGLLLGPIAVDARYRNLGLGADLVQTACDAAAAQGHGLILLVGAESFFSRVGFELVPRGQVTLPGPVDARRLLWRALKPRALDGVGGAAAGDRL